jgi:hypothetical protein
MYGTPFILTQEYSTWEEPKAEPRTEVVEAESLLWQRLSVDIFLMFSKTPLSSSGEGRTLEGRTRIRHYLTCASLKFERVEVLVNDAPPRTGTYLYRIERIKARPA